MNNTIVNIIMPSYSACCETVARLLENSPGNHKVMSASPQYGVFPSAGHPTPISCK